MTDISTGGAKDDDGRYRFTGHYVFRPPPEIEVLPISRHSWDTLKKKAGACATGDTVCSVIGSFCLAIAASAVTVPLTAHAPPGLISWIPAAWVVFWVSLAGAGACFVAALLLRRNARGMMDEIEANTCGQTAGGTK